MEYQVAWLGRFVAPDWLPEATLLQYGVTWGMVKAFEEDMLDTVDVDMASQYLKNS